MMPLFQDVFFVSMAVTIAFGLGFATLLTMVVVPVLYSIFFKVRAVGPPPATDGTDIDARPEASPQAA